MVGLADMVGIPLTSKNPNDKRKTLFAAEARGDPRGMAGNALRPPQGQLDAVYHEQSGKFYGSASVEDYNDRFTSTMRSIQNTITRLNNPNEQRDFLTTENTQGISGMFNNRLTDEKRQLYIGQQSSELERMQSLQSDFENGGYEQMDSDFMASYNAYMPEWNEYMDATWKNPRMADAQDRRVKKAKDKNTQDNTLAQALNALAIGNTDGNALGGKRTSRGTGVATTGGGILGGLEGAGLAI